MKKLFLPAAALMVLATACSDDEPIKNEEQKVDELPQWYYAGGEFGTAFLSTSNALEQPTPAVEEAGLYQSFKNGEAIFEKPFMSNATGVRSGLGPVYIRTSCIHCHPGYGHGKRVEAGSFKTDQIGNGCLLVVYNPQTEGYVLSLIHI